MTTGLASASLASAAGPARVTSMTDVLVGLSQNLECKFLILGNPMDARQVFSPAGFLPVLAWLVQDGGRRFLDADFGCILKKDDPAKSFFSARCVVPPTTGHIADVMRALFFIHYATDMLGLQQNAEIELSPLFEALAPVFLEHMSSMDVPVDIGEEVTWPQMSRVA